jgi:hypothetical protein
MLAAVTAAGVVGGAGADAGLAELVQGAPR